VDRHKKLIFENKKGASPNRGSSGPHPRPTLHARSMSVATCEVHTNAASGLASQRRLGPPSVTPPRFTLKDLTCCTCHHRGRWSHAMEEGGAAVSCDKEGRRVIAWEVALWRSRLLWKKKGASLSPCSRATGPPLAAAIVEEGRSKVTPPCTEERERERAAAAPKLGE
jgi:hypothetical protein